MKPRPPIGDSRDRKSASGRDWILSIDGADERDRTARGAPLKVLVVDDLPTNRKVLKHLVEKCGVAADVCGSGEEAIRLCGDGADGYHLVLMDLHMPGMSGFEAGEEIVRRRAGVLPRVVAQTADETPRACERTRAIGFDGHLTKPIRPSALLELIREIRSAATT